MVSTVLKIATVRYQRPDHDASGQAEKTGFPEK